MPEREIEWMEVESVWWKRRWFKRGRGRRRRHGEGRREMGVKRGAVTGLRGLGRGGRILRVFYTPMTLLHTASHRTRTP